MTTTRIVLVVPEGWQGAAYGRDNINKRVNFIDVGSDQKIWPLCQKLIEGYIEVLPITRYERTPENNGAPFSQGWHLAAYVNDNGIGLGMAPNIIVHDTPLFGPVVFVHERVDGEGVAHYRDIDADDWDKIKAMVLVAVSNPEARQTESP